MVEKVNIEFHRRDLVAIAESVRRVRQESPRKIEGQRFFDLVSEHIRNHYGESVKSLPDFGRVRTAIVKLVLDGGKAQEFLQTFPE